MIKSLTQFFLLIFSATTIFAVVSCASEDSGAPKPNTAPTKTKKEILTSYNWVITSVIFNGSESLPFLGCAIDDIDKFFTNGDFVIDDNIFECSSGDPKVFVSKWELTDNETVIERTDGKKLKIVELTETTLITEEGMNTINNQYRRTYKAIPTYTNILTNAKGWKLTGASDVGEDFFDNLPQCETDNILTFKKDGTMTDDEGATKCDANDPQTKDTGTWKFSDYETKVTISTLGTDPYSIVELSTTRMVINDGFGLEYTFTPQ